MKNFSVIVKPNMQQGIGKSNRGKIYNKEKGETLLNEYVEYINSIPSSFKNALNCGKLLYSNVDFKEYPDFNKLKLIPSKCSNKPGDNTESLIYNHIYPIDIVYGNYKINYKNNEPICIYYDPFGNIEEDGIPCTMFDFGNFVVLLKANKLSGTSILEIEEKNHGYSAYLYLLIKQILHFGKAIPELMHFDIHLYKCIEDEDADFELRPDNENIKETIRVSAVDFEKYICEKCSFNSNINKNNPVNEKQNIISNQDIIITIMNLTKNLMINAVNEFNESIDSLQEKYTKVIENDGSYFEDNNAFMKIAENIANDIDNLLNKTVEKFISKVNKLNVEEILNNDASSEIAATLSSNVLLDNNYQDNTPYKGNNNINKNNIESFNNANKYRTAQHSNSNVKYYNISGKRYSLSINRNNVITRYFDKSKFSEPNMMEYLYDLLGNIETTFEYDKLIEAYNEYTNYLDPSLSEREAHQKRWNSQDSGARFVNIDLNKETYRYSYGDESIVLGHKDLNDEFIKLLSSKCQSTFLNHGDRNDFEILCSHLSFVFKISYIILHDMRSGLLNGVDDSIFKKLV